MKSGLAKTNQLDQSLHQREIVPHLPQLRIGLDTILIVVLTCFQYGTRGVLCRPPQRKNFNINISTICYALVVFRAKELLALKTTRAFGRNISKSCFLKSSILWLIQPTHVRYGLLQLQLVIAPMKTAILSWLQNDGSREFSKDQLKGKRLSLMFQPDALVVFRTAPKTTI